MLYRQDSTGLIMIGQPSHAWVAGQLARAWGNEHFGDVAPWEEVCLAAEQHDLAHALWERIPRLNPQTGRPYSFLDMPADMRLTLVSSASALLMMQSRYGAPLVSLHFTGLYETYDLRRASGEEEQAMRDFLAREDAFQQQMLVSLRDDPTYAPYATAEMVTRNRHLLRTWDALSLALCFGLEPRKVFSHVPTNSGETTLTVTRVEDDPTKGTVDPWPFHQEAVMLPAKDGVCRKPLPMRRRCEWPSPMLPGSLLPCS